MPAGLGRILVYASLLVSTVGAMVGFAAGKSGSRQALKWARRFAYAYFLIMVAATAVMETALLTHDFSVSYVEHVGSRELPVWVTIVSLWSSLEGSILFWGFILAIYIAPAPLLTRDKHCDYMQHAYAT